jgi:hypothetical protein
MTGTPVPGILFTGTYLTKNYNPGVPGQPTVFDALANPPATGEAAEANAEAATTALGVVAPPAQVLALRTANRDYVKDFYDDASVLNALHTDPNILAP